MKRLNYASLLSLLPALLLPFAAAAQDGAGEILEAQATATADVETLKAEHALLETIGKGVSLSLAECEATGNCEGTLERAELEQLVATVEQRINGLVQRQAEGGDAAVDDLLIAYAIVRDTYSQQLEHLGQVMPLEQGELDDAFGDELPAAEPEEAASSAPDEFSIFEDADESLSDEPAADDAADSDPEQ